VIRGRLGGALFAAGLAFGLTSGLTFGAVAADFHEIFESRCLSCHGHAGGFARTSLTEVDGVLTGTRSGRDVADFLHRHAGGLSPPEITLFVGVFIAQVNSGGFYKARCDICHEQAYDLARLRLIQREGKLVGRYSGRDMASFLPNHARMTAEEADRMLQALTALRMGAR
jgi:hypothetical protein